MIDAYVVRDPQGRVIGMSVDSVSQALGDVHDNYQPNDHGCGVPYNALVALFNRDGRANVNGYTLRKEQVAL
jgi:hypothetical protein